MKVMVLGGGGREHAVVHALSKSKITTELHCCPGNPGIAKLALCHAGDPCDPKAMKELCTWLGIELVFVGPEAPLVAGTADALREAGILVVGPGASGARLEGSKAFSKTFMKSTASQPRTSTSAQTSPSAKRRSKSAPPPSSSRPTASRPAKARSCQRPTRTQSQPAA